MASSIPSQIRAVDPFASFNSNTVNKLTEMITRGSNGLTDYNALQVTSDSTAPLTQCVVSTGTIYKDDVMIDMTDPHVVDFTDSSHYVSFGTGFDEAGIYYIVLEYTYAKSRPAPQAKIKILKPIQIPSLFGTTLFFLKAVQINFSGSAFYIDQYYDYDPSTPSVKRTYTPLYFGVETGLPTHSKERDQGRVIYDSETNAFYFGLENSWIESPGVIDNVKGTIETGDWILDSGSYRKDIDITSLDTTGFAIITSFFAENSGVMEQITPSKVQLIDNYNTARVWMNINTVDVLYNFSV